MCLIQMGGKMPEDIDVVVVSAIWDMQNIKTILESKLKCPIISLNEVDL